MPLAAQEHRHSYVRKNAVLAILAIYPSFESLIPDAPELIQVFLAAVLIIGAPCYVSTHSAFPGIRYYLSTKCPCFPLQLCVAESRRKDIIRHGADSELGRTDATCCN